MTRKRKMSEREFRRICSRNGGYWDGVADRKAQRIAKWCRGAHKNYGHFDPDYAEGYSIGVFGGDPPPYAMGEYR